MYPFSLRLCWIRNGNQLTFSFSYTFMILRLKFKISVNIVTYRKYQIGSLGNHYDIDRKIYDNIDNILPIYRNISDITNMMCPIFADFQCYKPKFKISYLLSADQNWYHNRQYRSYKYWQYMSDNTSKYNMIYAINIGIGWCPKPCYKASADSEI